jgi:putative membrane protein
LLSAEERPAANARAPSLVGDPDPFAQASDETIAAAPMPARRWHWLRLLVAALGGLITLAIGLAIDNLIRDLFERTDWLGWLGALLAALAVLALAAIAIREIVGLLRLRHIDQIRRRGALAAADDDRSAARSVAREIVSLYSSLAETELLVALDENAKAMVLSSAKRVALLTAVSPRAIVDLVFVAAEILRLIRRLATNYGGRPGFLGFVRLARAAFAHLAITGGMAAGDSILQQFLGHGIAARLSARLGEGVVNGLLTARIGIAAVDVCRPLPFIVGRAPRLADVMSELTRLGAQASKSKQSA